MPRRFLVFAHVCTESSLRGALYFRGSLKKSPKKSPTFPPRVYRSVCLYTAGPPMPAERTHTVANCVYPHHSDFHTFHTSQVLQALHTVACCQQRPWGDPGRPRPAWSVLLLQLLMGGIAGSGAVMGVVEKLVRAGVEVTSEPEVVWAGVEVAPEPETVRKGVEVGPRWRRCGRVWGWFRSRRWCSHQRRCNSRLPAGHGGLPVAGCLPVRCGPAAGRGGTLARAAGSGPPGGSTYRREHKNAMQLLRAV